MSPDNALLIVQTVVYCIGILSSSWCLSFALNVERKLLFSFSMFCLITCLVGIAIVSIKVASLL